MSTRDAVVAIRNFLGLNRRDGADLVALNEFLTLQNVYPLTKGMFYKRGGTEYEFDADGITGASKLLGVSRLYDVFGDQNTLYYCDGPTSAGSLNNPAAPTVVQGAPGTHDAWDATGAWMSGATNTLGNEARFCYAWVGLGQEWLPSDQTILTGYDTTKEFQVTVPAFPDGIKSANVYVRFPNAANAAIIPMTASWTYIGRATPSSLTVTWGQKPADRDSDPVSAPAAGRIVKISVNPFGGTLKAGTYYITACRFRIGSGAVMRGPVGSVNARQNLAVCNKTAPSATPTEGMYMVVNVEEDGSSIDVKYSVSGDAGWTDAGGGYAHGQEKSKYVRWFIGTKPPTEAPCMDVGLSRIGWADTITSPTYRITELPEETNAATTPINLETAGRIVVFDLAPVTVSLLPTGMLVKQKSDGTLKEVLPSGSQRLFGGQGYATGAGVGWDRSYEGYPVDEDLLDYPLDPYTGLPVKRLHTTGSPIGFTRRECILPSSIRTSRMSFTPFMGLSFMASGVSPLWGTDGFTTFNVVEDEDTILPGDAREVMTFKNKLVCSIYNVEQDRRLNQIFASTTLSFTNWADGGTGTDLRFATAGDGFGDGVFALGIYNFNSATDGPSSKIAAFKKASIWVFDDVADSVSGGGTGNAISGRIGCYAPRTVVPTNIGLVFLGSDGDVYLVSGSGGEPRKIGGKISNLLSHLVDNDTLMAKCTASFHRGFYKLSYPSSSTATTSDAQLWADLRVDQNSPISWCGPHRGVEISDQIVLVGAGDAEQRLVVIENTNATAFTDLPSTFEDLGEPITSVIEWKTSRFGNELNRKRYMGMFFDIYYDSQYAHEIMLEGFADDQYTQKVKTLSTGTAIWDSSSFDTGSLWGDAQFFPVPVPFGPDNLVGRTFRWKLTHANNAQLIVSSAILGYQAERRTIYE